MPKVSQLMGFLELELEYRSLTRFFVLKNLILCLFYLSTYEKKKPTVYPALDTWVQAESGPLGLAFHKDTHWIVSLSNWIEICKDTH